MKKNDFYSNTTRDFIRSLMTLHPLSFYCQEPFSRNDINEWCSLYPMHIILWWGENVRFPETTNDSKWGYNLQEWLHNQSLVTPEDIIKVLNPHVMQINKIGDVLCTEELGKQFSKFVSEKSLCKRNILKGDIKSLVLGGYRKAYTNDIYMPQAKEIRDSLSMYLEKKKLAPSPIECILDRNMRSYNDIAQYEMGRMCLIGNITYNFDQQSAYPILKAQGFIPD